MMRAANRNWADSFRLGTPKGSSFDSCPQLEARNVLGPMSSFALARSQSYEKVGLVCYSFPSE